MNLEFERILAYTSTEMIGTQGGKQIDAKVGKIKRQKGGANAMKLDVFTVESMQNLRQVYSKIKS